MRVYSIIGKLWDMTPFQEGYSDVKLIKSDIFKSVSKDLLKNKTPCRGLLRIFSDRKVRVKAKAIIESSPIQHTEHNIYYDRKGYYSNIKGKKVYLEPLVDDKTIFDETTPEEFMITNYKVQLTADKNSEPIFVED